MKLTKWERLSAYQIMLAEAEKPNRYWNIDDDKFSLSNCAGFCFMFWLVFGDDTLFDSLEFKETLPELRIKKPFNSGAFWFDSGEWQQRIELLKSCIAQLEVRQ